MGIAALKQYSEKQKHRGLACVDASAEGTSKQQSVRSQYFLKSTKPSVTNEIPSSSAAGSGGGWTVKELATKAEIIVTMQYAVQNIPFSNAENLSACYQEQFPASLIAKNVSIGPNKMSYVVRYGLGPYFRQLDIVEGNLFSHYNLMKL